MINQLIVNNVNDPENPKTNYELAIEYERIGQTAAAISYFLRSSERTNDKHLSYECLIRIGNCFDRQKNRAYTVKSMYQAAMCILPERPEAYYLLSRLYENDKNYIESYLMAELALKNTKDHKNIDVGYKGRWLLLFQKAVSAWWRGRGMESRKIFQILLNEHWHELDQSHKEAVERNITSLGSGPKEYAHRVYNKSLHSKLRYKFAGSENIERNFSQVYQDMFILSMLDGKRNGTFLEIGAADPFLGNNTYLLEKHFDWKGVSIEFNEGLAQQFKAARKSNLLVTDALQVDYRELLRNNFNDKIIDYLQVDIEPARNTFECLLKIPFDEYKFRVITYEHDYYVDVTREYREKSREYLRSKGYVLVANDIAPDDMCNFEDWWVYPDLVNYEILNTMTDITDKPKAIEKYMLIPEERFYEWHGCDKYIRDNFFSDKSYKGIVVEVGSGPPEFLSMSKHFRDLGWRAICVEPNPKFVSQHKERGNEIYEYACSEDEGLSEFIINLSNDESYTEENDGVSFSSLGIRIDGLPKHNIQQKIQVQKVRLNTILEKISVDRIDLLSIDVEGWELEVLRGFDLAKYKPKVVMLENNINCNEYEKYMIQHGYVKNTVIGGNEIYVRENELINAHPKTETTFDFNTDMRKTSWIVDSFYSNPDKVRKFALEQDYLEGGLGRGFIGRRTHQQFLFPGLKEKFQDIMGMKITNWESHGMNGRFQVAWSGEPLVYHCDSQRWAGMLYLSPGAPFQCGTTLYAHKQTRARTYYDQGWDAAWQDVPGDCHLDGTPFEPVDVLGNVYNRLVIFDASCIHSASQYFGTVTTNARLWQMFFFDAE